MSNNLISSLRKSDTGDSLNKIFDPVLVYCRVRPLQTSTNVSNVVVQSPTTIILKSPSSSSSPHIVTSPKQFLEHETHYVFNHVFGPQSKQSEVYKVIAQPLVEKLIRGRSSLLFSYGVTESGKTYTMTGGSKELGIMPRCLYALFRSIEGFQAQKFIFQSDHMNGFEIVSHAEAITKQKTENLHHITIGRSAQRYKSTEIEYDLKGLEDTVPLPGVDENNVFAVFISYTEVYNNCVYDLLEECSLQRCLQSRIVREDSNRNMYVHGVTEIEIKSVQEAMEAFNIGQKHKKIGHTVLNAESSRSHSIFNIRLVQAPVGEYARENKHIITISQLSLVDLAGSERSFRANNSGARFRESGNINNSLMTLRTCLEYLRENQISPGNTPRKIPYRHSKLTQLFKNFFEGEGQVSMIACIHPRLEDFSENSQVMKFAEMTQEIRVPRASRVQLSTNENDIVNFLKNKFIGYGLELPTGDGPLSEKLIIMLQQYLEKSKKDSEKLKDQCENYRQRIYQLEQENKKLNDKLNEEQKHHQIVCLRNQVLEEAVCVHRESLETLKQEVESQTERLETAEKTLQKIQSSKKSLKVIHKLKYEESTTIDKLLTGTADNPPKKINFKLINKFIELIERDEL